MKKSPNRNVAFKSDTVATEMLPLPIVLYPGFYGAFFAFKNEESKIAFFCSCAYEAIENYIELRIRKGIPENTHKHRMYILDSAYFPLSVVEKVIKKNLEARDVLKNLNFKECLCHECNSLVPKYRFCNAMYGGVFKQNFGWYIKKQGFEWGIDSGSLQYLPGRCPDEILEVMKIAPPPNGGLWADLLSGQADEGEEIRKTISRQNRSIWNIIENEVRRKFGHKKIGEAWTSETILYYMIKRIFPQYTVHRHYRPEFLGGLELDIFLEEPQIGIEYQGVQHYKPVKHWGGEDGLKKTKERDSRKKMLCESRKIPVVYFEHDEPLGYDLVHEKIESILR